MHEKERTPSGGAASGELNPARNGVARERVSEIQRARMLAAMVQELAERGAAKVSVAHVVARSGVSRRTFYETFEDREDCLLAALDDALARIAAVAIPAYQDPGTWRTKVRAALTSLLAFLDHDRDTGRLVIVESLGAGPRVLERRQNVLASPILAIVDRGRTEAKSGMDPPPLTAEGVVGGVLAVLHARLTESDSQPLLRLLNQLMSMIVLPYLGPAAARKEFERPAPKIATRQSTSVAHDPLRELGVRLTYRTVRVLMAVAADPGSSNRELADAAGIADQGQISKLLRRLHRLGLIENTGAGVARGAPNAWVLTERGRDVEGVIGHQASDA